MLQRFRHAKNFHSQFSTDSKTWAGQMALWVMRRQGLEKLLGQFVGRHKHWESWKGAAWKRSLEGRN